MTRLKLPPMVVASFILAIAAFICSPWIFWDLTKNQRLTDFALLCSALMGPIWILVASISVWFYGKRALWVLFGLPFALASDAWFVLLFYACATGRGCL